MLNLLKQHLMSLWKKLTKSRLCHEVVVVVVVVTLAEEAQRDVCKITLS
jgi:hypothetical protein